VFSSETDWKEDIHFEHLTCLDLLFVVQRGHFKDVFKTHPLRRKTERTKKEIANSARHSNRIKLLSIEYVSHLDSNHTLKTGTLAVFIKYKG